MTSGLPGHERGPSIILYAECSIISEKPRSIKHACQIYARTIEGLLAACMVYSNFYTRANLLKLHDVLGQTEALNCSIYVMDAKDINTMGFLNRSLLILRQFCRLWSD